MFVIANEIRQGCAWHYQKIKEGRIPQQRGRRCSLQQNATQRSSSDNRQSHSYSARLKLSENPQTVTHHAEAS